MKTSAAWMAAVFAACTFAASAQGQVAPAAGQVEHATGTAPVDGTGRAQAEADAERDCLRHTGSLIRARHDSRRAGRDDCIEINGRSYSRGDLERTGQIDLGEALRRLDPSIR